MAHLPRMCSWGFDMNMTVAFWFKRFVPWLGFILLSVEAQVPHGPVTRVFRHDRDVDTGFSWIKRPHWEHGVVVGFYNNDSSGPVIYSIGADGYRNETLFSVPDGARLHIFDIAASANGELAIVSSALTADTRGTAFLARISADRTSQTVTRTWPYCPHVVTFAPDGTLWTVGNLKSDDGTKGLAIHVVRRFDSSGKLLGSLTVGAQDISSDEESYLRASRDRVGWFTWYGEYFEFSLDGRQIGHYKGPDGATQIDITGFALSDADDAVVGRTGKTNADFLVLDREGRTWMPAELPKDSPVPAWAGVMGFDGQTLVTLVGKSPGILRRFLTQ